MLPHPPPRVHVNAAPARPEPRLRLKFRGNRRGLFSRVSGVAAPARRVRLPLPTGRARSAPRPVSAGGGPEARIWPGFAAEAKRAPGGRGARRAGDRCQT